MTVLMKCGHAANASVDGHPVCSLCLGKTLFATMPDDNPPALIGRVARCRCGAVATSSVLLTGFRYRGAGSMDARMNCKVCGIPIGVHLFDSDTAGHIFVPHGPYDYDDFYCGHGNE